MSRTVEFVRYTGKWPNLCGGILTIRVDGKDVDFEYVMCSGGNCGFTDGYKESFVNKGEWSVSLPDEYKDIQTEVEALVNCNVSWGCCGGCL